MTSLPRTVIDDDDNVNPWSPRSQETVSAAGTVHVTDPDCTTAPTSAVGTWSNLTLNG